MNASAFSQVLPLLLAVLLFPGCHHAGTPESPLSYTVPVPDSCREEPGHRYYISEPGNIPARQKLPLILAIDPHGDGKLAADEFSSALRNIPAIVAGSDKIKNNDPEFVSSLSRLEADVRSKYPVDPEKIIVAGFSGGARMAFYYGMNHRVLGIIMFGAGPGQSIRDAGSRRVYMASGTRDFNFMEQYLPPFTGMQDARSYMTDFFRGTHEWPPAETIYESVAWILKDEPGFPGNIPEDISAELLAECDSLEESNDLFLAAKALEKAWVFAPEGRQRDRISRKIEEFREQPGWNSSRKEFEGYLQMELKLKKAYVDRLADPDTAWWKNEIQSLNRNISSCTDPEKEDFLYRLKGFIGIVLYSRINSLIREGLHTGELDRLMVIYEMAEPYNPDLIKFKKQVQQL